VQYKVGSLTVGLDPHGHAKGMTGPVAYWVVEDLHGTIKQLLEAGATLHKGAANVGGGKSIATLIDADGNMIGLAELP
jgi:predicted enzyme related to lactoylglutathione lyase